MAPYIQRSAWDSCECRVERNVNRILELLDARGIKATFFTLGWIAKRYPGLVRQLVEQGHELASHGFGHERASDLDRERFSADIRKAKAILEDLSGNEIKGYRAPSFSIGLNNQWAFDCIAEAGYRYSSSIYPIRHDHYGMPDAPRFAFQARSELLEIPVTTVRLLNRNLPSSGGGYFRLFPYAVSRWLLQRVNQADQKPGIFYFHPWEIDPGQPVVAGIDAKTRFRHYVNLSRMEPKLCRLFDDFQWGRMDEVFLRPALVH